MKQILCLMLCIFHPIAAYAQDEFIDKYYPIIVPADDTGVFALAGDIDIRTSLNFKRAIKEFGVPDVFILSSGGGLVYIGLDLAMEVHRLGITTVIPEDLSCYSACSFVFLAGKERYLDGELGIHQISADDADLQRGQFTLADMIDVLNSFDVPAALYPPMLSTPPDQIYVVSSDEIEELGLDSRVTPVGQKKPVATRSELEQQAINFVLQLQFDQSSESNSTTKQMISKYDQYVQYYGRTYSSDEIYQDKLNFFKRWPVRTYKIDENRSSIRCNNLGVCFFSGVTIWSAHSPERNAKAAGEAKIEYELEYKNGNFKVVQENSIVIKRQK